MGAWIEIDNPQTLMCGTPSHPTMGAWIEIALLSFLMTLSFVAPHDGCVD